MSEIIIFILALIVLALLSFIIYLFSWRRNLIKITPNAPIEIENFLIILNEKIDDQFKETNKHIKNLEKNHEKHQKDILNRMLTATETVENRIKIKFKELKAILDKLKKDTHNEVEKITHKLDVLTQSEQEIAEENKLNLKKTDKCIRDNLLAQISEIKNQLDALQEYALDNNQKIRRFEDGYDLKIQNEFVRSIISTIEYMEKQNRKSKNDVLEASVLEAAIEDLNILLENNGIYKIEVNTDNYRGQVNIAKVALTEPTNDPSKNDVIKEVLKDGYYIEVGERKKIIKPAEVVIYKIEEK